MTSQPKTTLTAIKHIGKFIKPQQAETAIAAWQTKHPKGIFSFLYGRHVFDTMLAAPGCDGIRIFNGINDEGKQALVFIGTDAQGGHIFSYQLQNAEGLMLVEDPIWDLGIPCPPRCDIFGDIHLGYLWKQVPDNSLDISRAGENISRQKASAMIDAWQSQMPDSVYSFLFGREGIEALLALPNCAGIVVFNGINEEDNQQTLILLPVDAKGVNITQYKVPVPEGIEFRDGLILDGGIPELSVDDRPFE